ncbi:MAG TPA: zf-HC2 domain-containing protein [Ignavibacteriaceae bacterium]|nr:zf-HC2 domain-containing protein [Ignavibacteriaceae bacterium]
MNESNVTCKEVMNHICDSLGEDLDSPKCVAIKSHLSECSNCRNYFTSVEKTIKFYQMYNLDVPEESHKRLMKKLGLDE